MRQSTPRHAIHALYSARLARATRPYLARGAGVDRCPSCMLVRHFCVCEYRAACQTHAAFMLLMYDDEVLKPSNTGRLIADCVADTYAFIWSRTQPDPDMLALLSRSAFQPYVVFPAQYTTPTRMTAPARIHDSAKRPLFIIIDGTWREAKKIFRKSPWLDHFPVLSIEPQALSRYRVRDAHGENQLATAEVAAEVLAVNQEHKAADYLNQWFDVFRERYLAGKRQKHLAEDNALTRFLDDRPLVNDADP
ncbi:tRNA-uridine aminocarboxypropyltransferase [Salinivibrio sp. ML290]|uniref:tRNA-uridine aminocarboxypropyltransferase n=1 Tax=Salinivibrio sp. ML290 TaxID=1909468 RepID=UPI000988634C|nr:tRNA-uridine aminocarboxypropyltransferase [Salinivibrio sp. ML290]OOE75826.1 DTW domain-containing protein [Salinivibrio sp. ML290]